MEREDEGEQQEQWEVVLTALPAALPISSTSQNGLDFCICPQHVARHMLLACSESTSESASIRSLSLSASLPLSLSLSHFTQLVQISAYLPHSFFFGSSF